MTVLILYATNEGHTRRIARAVARQCLNSGHAVELLPASEADSLDPALYSGAILAGSLHAGHYQKALAQCASAHHEALNSLPGLFISVSLAAAGHDADDWRTLDDVAHDLHTATGWTPDKTLHVAGAYMPSKYDIVSRFVMRRIIAKKDPGADLDADKVYTDWEALAAGIGDWLKSLPAQ